MGFEQQLVVEEEHTHDVLLPFESLMFTLGQRAGCLSI